MAVLIPETASFPAEALQIEDTMRQEGRTTVIQHVRVKNLRGIREGALENLTPLTVLVGGNGSGKSTLLEAMLIGASTTPGAAIVQAVTRHQGVLEGARWLLWRSGDRGDAEIAITANKKRPRKVFLSAKIPESGEHLAIGYRGAEEERNDPEIWVNFTRAEHASTAGSVSLKEIVTDIRLMETFGSSLKPLHLLFASVVEKGRRNQVREVLSQIVSGLQDIELLVEVVNSPILHLVFEDHSVPAALAGDGIQSLLRMSLELASRR